MAPGRPRLQSTTPSTIVHTDPTPVSPSLPSTASSLEPPVLNTTTGSTTSTTTRRGRGKTRGLALLKIVRAGGKIKVNIPKGKNRAVGPDSQYFTTEIGVIARQYLSLQVSDYSTFTNEDKDVCYRHILDKFDIDISQPHVKETCEYYMRERFNKNRHRLHKVFQQYPSKEEASQHLPNDICQEDWNYLCSHFSSSEYQKRSKINKENRAKLKVSHNTGTKSFSRVRYDARHLVTEEEPDRISFWKTCHYNTEKGWTDPTAEALYNEMIELEARCIQEGTPMTKDEICDKVLGTKPGYIRGLGYGPKPTSCSRRGGNSEATEEARKRAEDAEKRAAELAKEVESHRLLIEAQQNEIETQNAHIDEMTTRQSQMEATLESILSHMPPFGDRSHIS